MKKLKALLVVAVLVLGFIAVDATLTTVSASAHPAACVAHGETSTDTPQGPSPQSGVNSWRHTNFINVPNNGCGGIWMANPTNCGYFFADRVTPAALDWAPAQVCGAEMKLVDVCASCSMRPGDLFAWYQVAGTLPGAHVHTFTLYY